MKFFFSVDWGTSTFRLRLIDAANRTVLVEIKADHGIAATFENWKQINQPEKNRIAFYQAYLFEQVEKIACNFDDSLNNTPIILSGMVSSSIGMLELPYKELPFCCDGSDLLLHTIPVQKEKGLYDIIIISGVKSQTDVMRGEETILVGCDVVKEDGQQLFIFPGTHSKHVTVNNYTAQSVTTFITGELFDLLSNKSIFSASLKKNNINTITNDTYFVDGVKKGVSTNILSSIFKVRTNQLFKIATAQQNYQYLSGLLIGYELKEIEKIKPDLITLVSSEGLEDAYIKALTVLDLTAQVVCMNADEALINGQWKIMQQAGYFL
jgi:2-dehydro-3-deoxygalactonokinase